MAKRIRIVFTIAGSDIKSRPMTIYKNEDSPELGETFPVRLSYETSTNPGTGLDEEQVQLSGEGFIRSHQKSWWEEDPKGIALSQFFDENEASAEVYVPDPEELAEEAKAIGERVRARRIQLGLPV